MKKQILNAMLCSAAVLTSLVSTACTSNPNKTASSAKEETNMTTKESTTSPNETESLTEPVTEPTSPAIQAEEFADVTAWDIVNSIKIGWNLGNSFDSAVDTVTLPRVAEMHWGNPLTTQEIVDTVYNKGFNAIRIPVTWDAFTSSGPAYNINTAWLERVQEVVDYAISNDMYVILNMHHENWIDLELGEMEQDLAQYTSMWNQIATRFAGYDEHLIFEALNEPREIGKPQEWVGGTQEGREFVNDFTRTFVETVRTTGGNNDRRLLLIPGYAASSMEISLAAIEVPEDDMIAVSVHAYIPYNFALNTSGTDKWNSDTADIDTLMKNLDKLFLSKDIPVILGEFGAVYKNNDDERVEWARYYVTAATEHNIPCFWWDNNAFSDNGEALGLLDRRTLEWRFPELTDVLIEASSSR